MHVKVIAVSLPEELVQAIDRAALANYANRSEYIRSVITARLVKEKQLDAETEARIRKERMQAWLRSLPPDTDDIC